MLSPETLEAYRRMTPSERLRLTLDLSESAWSAMLKGSPEIVARRFQRLREENDQRTASICQALKRCRSTRMPEEGFRHVPE